MNDKTFRIYDSTLNVRSQVTRTDTDFLAHDKYLVNSMKRTMKKAGYSFRQDVTVAKCIRRGYFAGSKGDVHFAADANCSGLKIEFYEDVIRDNKCGGRYHFDKMAKMPYLRRLKVKLILEKLSARLELIGYTEDKGEPRDRAWAFVQRRRESLIGFQGRSMYEEPRQPYNDTDADGVRIQDGDVRYYRDYSGHLKRGVAWHNINNMWWVICSEDDVDNVAAFQMFTYDSARHPRRVHHLSVERLERKLSKLVENQDFEQAIGVRDALRRISRKLVEVK